MNHPSILPGAEPFYLKGGPVGVLLCHGFTGSTQSMRPLGERLHAAGLTVIAPRLAGHGTTVQDMAASTAADWIASVDAALDELRVTCTQVFMAGLSMGGALTLYTAAQRADLIRGAITINAPVHIGSPDLAALALARQAPELIPGVGSDIKAPGVKELAYEQLPVPALRQIYALLAVTRDLLPRVRCPVLVMQSREDHVVQPVNATLIAGGVGASQVELQWLDDSYHVATLDHDKERIAEKVTAFIQSLAGS